MKRKEIVKELASDIGEGVHTGLRKWTEDPKSSIAWHAINDMAPGEWESICEIVADYIYPSMRKEFFKQFKKSHVCPTRKTKIV